MEFATEDHSSHLGSCAGDFLCSYMSTIAWRTPTQPLPMEINPRVVFERMFGGDGATPAARQARLAQNTSILDAVRESVADLQRGLGAKDRAKLGEYAENVREIERRIQQAERQRTDHLLDTPPVPIGVPENWEEHVKLMFELMALAYQGDMTRVTTFMMARELSTLTYPQIGVADGHHPVSHNNGVAEQVAKKAKIDAYHLGLFAGFLDRLKATPDGDGSLLDHSLFLYGSGMSNGNQHTHDNLPILTVGSAAGKLAGGRHIRLDNYTPLSNLMLTILDKAGVPMEQFGESWGRSISERNVDRRTRDVKRRAGTWHTKREPLVSARSPTFYVRRSSSPLPRSARGRARRATPRSSTPSSARTRPSRARC